MFGDDQDPDLGKATQFKEGNNANPNGRGGVPSFRKVYARLLALEATDPDTHEKLGITQQELLAMKKMKAAIDGNLSASNSIEDRMDGKSIQPNIEVGEQTHGEWIDEMKSQVKDWDSSK